MFSDLDSSASVVAFVTASRPGPFSVSVFSKCVAFWFVKSLIIPRVRVGYEMVFAKEACSVELAIVISYPTSASGVVVLLKTPTKYREFFQNLFVKTTDFQLVFNFEQTRTVTIFESML